MAIARRQVPLRLREEMVVAVDEARGDVSRTRWIERAIEAALGAGRVSVEEKRPSGMSGRFVAPDRSMDVIRPDSAMEPKPPATSPRAPQVQRPTAKQLQGRCRVPLSTAERWLASGEWERYWDG